MTQLGATMRHRPGPLAGTFVALFAAAVVVTMAATLARTGQTLKPPVQRLAGAAAVATGNPKVRIGEGKQADTMALTGYRRLPVSLTPRLAAVSGVSEAIPDVSIPVALQQPGRPPVTGSTADPLTGHGWASAALTPFSLRAGHAPTTAGQIVVGAGVAARGGLRLGSDVRLAGSHIPPFEVVGIAGSPRGDPAQDWTIFFTDAEARLLYGHPGEADLIGILGHPDPDALRRAAHGVTVSFGASRGNAEHPEAANDGSTLSVGALSVGIDLAVLALFVVAGTVALSVGQRSRTMALLRAVGATPGQVRRLVVVELAALGVLAGLAGYLPGVALSNWALQGMADHQLVPASAHAATVPWMLAVSVGAGLVIAELAGFVAGRRASRVPPAVAIGEARVERRWPHPLRVLLGLCALGGGVTLGILALDHAGSATNRLNMTLFMLLSFLAAIAFLGPLLVAAAELVVRLPLRALAPLGARLALPEIRIRPRRMASAVVAVALSVAFAGAFFVIDATQTHAAMAQGRQRLAADEIVTAPGPGLSPQALHAVRATPGVAAAVGLTPTTVFTPNPGSESTSAEVVTPGDLDAVLRLQVVAGSLDRFGPGDIALSRLVTGSGAIGTRVGDTITTYLPDGTAYRAKVVAIFARSIGFADALLPSAAADGHVGTDAIGSILVRNAGPSAPALGPLAAGFPGLEVASRSVVNAQDAHIAAQDSYLNDLALGLILALAAITLVNTLLVTTLERREILRLLHRVGATPRQLVRATALQAATLGAVGIALGGATGAAAILAATKALTGSWEPYVPWPAPVGLVCVVATLCLIATAGPAAWMLSGKGARR
ncbi:MAG: FtsX-like permease family protein [Acidimicrobiaceae bacterium]|nr:FtsX-like permease family protein [Acidimicrobiaceae bacterium]